MEAFKQMHPGYEVRVTSARRLGGGPHSSPTGALDLQIIDPQGRAIPNRGDDPTGLYAELARLDLGFVQQRYPELYGQYAWGGAFGTQRPSGGPPDLMHRDISGRRGRYSFNDVYALGPLVREREQIDRASRAASFDERFNGNLNASIDFKNMPSWVKTSIDANGAFRNVRVTRSTPQAGRAGSGLTDNNPWSYE